MGSQRGHRGVTEGSWAHKGVTLRSWGHSRVTGMGLGHRKVMGSQWSLRGVTVGSWGHRKVTEGSEVRLTKVMAAMTLRDDTMATKATTAATTAPLQERSASC